jgi:hypothetical protein
MRRGAAAVLALYTAGIFLSLPVTPGLVRWAIARFGLAAVLLPVALLLGATGAVLLRRLLAHGRRAAPWPHLGLAALGAGAFAAWRLLASSPVGRVHLPEYGLLSVLAFRALGGSLPAAAGGGAAAAAIGLLDETVQAVTPGRVFDWWDVALNVAAALLGALACGWWRWTGPATSGGDPGAAPRPEARP